MSRTALSIAFFFAAAALPAQDDGWIQDFSKAKELAKTGQKHLLLDFTGSDWCGWCIKLDEEVFSQEAFRTAAPKDFVLVKLDYPNDESLVTPEIKAQNAELQQRYSIQGYPTILLTDAEGHVYAQTGYERGGATPYVAMLAAKKKQGDAFVAAMQRAGAKTGIERAAALDEALSALDEAVVAGHHLDTMAEIVKLDADGKGELKAKYEQRVAELTMQRDLEREAQTLGKAIDAHMRAGDGDKAIAHLDGVIQAPASALQHQVALFFKGMVIMDVNQDAKAAVEALEAAKKVLPDSPLVGRIDRILPDLRKHLDEGAEESGGDDK